MSRRVRQRRGFLLGAGAAVALANGARARGSVPRILDAGATMKAPVRVTAMQMLRRGSDFIVRATASDGATGFAIANQHASYLYPFFAQRVASFFVGKDARDLESLIDAVLVHASNYKLVGVPFFTCVSWAELSLLDLMGRLTGKPVGVLLGGKPLRQRVPMYLSSTDRATSPEEEVGRFEAAIAQTGARAVKFKVGGRMSGNADAAPGRTETLIALMRKRLGDRITLYADANGSFDVRKGIEVGRILEAHGVAIYEEPCPFEDYRSTRLVTAALKKLVVAGGEQDTSFYRFQEMVKDRVVDMVQPDVSYNGGLVRTTRVARLAAAAKLPISPHCPQASTMLYTLHLAAYTPNLGEFQEIHLSQASRSPWFAPGLKLEGGALAIPTTPGLGLEIDAAVLKAAVVL